MADTTEDRPTSRLRHVVDRGGLTESDLREATAEAGMLAERLRAEIDASEQRLGALTADPETGFAEIVDQLRRVELLRPELAEVEALVHDLEHTARELRTAWVRAQAEARLL
jgi:hypothetical protein